MNFGRSPRHLVYVVLAALSVLLAGLLVPRAPGASAEVAEVAATPVSFTDDFDGTALDSRWEVLNRDDTTLSVSNGALRVVGQTGDTYQTNNSAKNVVMLDVPAGDFTATATFTAPVSKIYQGAGLIAWKDMDNYVRSGLTYVGSLSPSGVAIENDAETGASFRAVKFTDRPASAGETLRMERTGATITTSYWDAGTSAWVPAGSVDVTFDTTQVGLYSLGALDGTRLDTAFDSFSIQHPAGADLSPTGLFALQATGDAPYLVAQGTTLALTPEQPTASLPLSAQPADGALSLTTGDLPLVVTDGTLGLGAAGDPATPLRLTDAGGGKLLLRTADGAQGLTLGADGQSLVVGALADAVPFRLSQVDATESSLVIDGDGANATIADTMFGIFFEDINYAADGGLYAELVRNRSFEFNGSDRSGFTGLTAWDAVSTDGTAPTALVVNDETRLNELNRNALRLVASGDGDGIRNAGFNNGFALEAGAGYDASVWARSTTAQPLTLQLQNAAGSTTYATGTVALDGSDVWKKYAVTLTSSTTTDAARLVVRAGAASIVGLDMVSLMPQDRWVGPVNGKSVLRKDLAEKIADLHPGFLRFPGGCVTNVGTFKTYAESGYADRRRTYQWKETIGPVEERPTNWNFWGYNQSYGIGYLEYLEFAEDLGAEPLPVVSVGANGCGSTIPEMHDQALIDRWVDDTVDLVEFANGGTDTEWGARRAALGHPAPFGLKMIGLGNEENTTTFEANFPQFRDALKAKYPDLKIISNSGPAPSGSRFDTLWNFNRTQKVDLVDEHYYMDPSWFLANTHRYDSYDRTGPKVFLGEYASKGNTMGNALSEAAYMTALQRNADVVRLASYAPLLANESYVQWQPDAIWFDNDESWGSANYYVQKMFARAPGDEVVPSTFDGPVNQTPDISGGVFLSTWSTSAAYDNVRVTSNDTGATLFDDQFADASQWSPQSGTWAADNGRYVQSSTSVNDARSIVNGAYTKNWSNYTLELDATKLSGNEGFLIGFGAKATNDFYWWNLGGWNNTRSVLQRANGGSANEVKAIEGTGVTTGQTYHVKIIVEGHTIGLYLDGQLQMTYDEAGSSESLFQVVTRDKATGDLVAKVVNTSTRNVRTNVDVTDAGVEPAAEVTTLVGAASDVNTKASPTKVAPVTRTLSGISEHFVYEFPATSVTFIRLHTKDAKPPTVDDVTLEGTAVEGWYDDPVTVRATASDDRLLDHIEFQVDGGAWQSPAAASVEVSGNGSHTVQVRAVDAAGNVGELRPVTFGIDTAAPVSNATVDATARTVTVRASDNGQVGVDRIETRIGTSGEWELYTAPVTVGDTETVVQFRAVDKLGNLELPGSVTVPAKVVVAVSTTTSAQPSTTKVTQGTPFTVAVTVASASGEPTGTVQVAVGASVLASGQLSGGAVTVTVPTAALAIGKHTLVVRYLGATGFKGSQASFTVTVSKK